MVPTSFLADLGPSGPSEAERKVAHEHVLKVLGYSPTSYIYGQPEVIRLESGKEIVSRRYRISRVGMEEYVFNIALPQGRRKPYVIQASSIFDDTIDAEARIRKYVLENFGYSPAEVKIGTNYQTFKSENSRYVRVVQYTVSARAERANGLSVLYALTETGYDGEVVGHLEIPYMMGIKVNNQNNLRNYELRVRELLHASVVHHVIQKRTAALLKVLPKQFHDHVRKTEHLR